MHEIVVTAAMGLIGAFVLWGAYRALEINWPEQYLSLNDTFALSVTQTWWRLVLYRFVPVLVLCVAVWSTTSRLGGSALLAVVAMVLIHVSHTNVRAILESLGVIKSLRQFSVNYALYHMYVVVVISAATAAAIIFGANLSFLVPQPDVLLDGIWIALFVSIFGGAMVTMMGKRPAGTHKFNAEYFVWRATRDVGLELTDYAFQAAIDYKSDPILIRSIMFAEVLQRPRWVRKFERLKGRLFSSGTYGVTQEVSNRPLSDKEAIARTSQKLQGQWAISAQADSWIQSSAKLWKMAAIHNEDLAFINGVQAIYQEVMSDRKLSRWGAFLEQLHVIEIRRYPQEFGIRGIAVADSIDFLDVPGVGKAQIERIERPIGIDRTVPWAFEAKFPIEVEALTLSIKMARRRSWVKLGVDVTNMEITFDKLPNAN